MRGSQAETQCPATRLSPRSAVVLGVPPGAAAAPQLAVCSVHTCGGRSTEEGGGGSTLLPGLPWPHTPPNCASSMVFSGPPNQGASEPDAAVRSARTPAPSLEDAHLLHPRLVSPRIRALRAHGTQDSLRQLPPRLPPVWVADGCAAQTWPHRAAPGAPDLPLPPCLGERSSALGQLRPDGLGPSWSPFLNPRAPRGPPGAPPFSSQRPHSWAPCDPWPGLSPHSSTEVALNMSDHITPLLGSLSAPHLPPTQDLSPGLCNGLGPRPTLTPAWSPCSSGILTPLQPHRFLHGPSNCWPPPAPGTLHRPFPVPVPSPPPPHAHVPETTYCLWVSAIHAWSLGFPNAPI